MLRSLLGFAAVTATVTSVLAQAIYLPHEVAATLWPKGHPEASREFIYTGNLYPTREACDLALAGGDTTMITSLLMLGQLYEKKAGEFEAKLECRLHNANGSPAPDATK